MSRDIANDRALAFYRKGLTTIMGQWVCKRLMERSSTLPYSGSGDLFSTLGWSALTQHPDMSLTNLMPKVL